MAQLIEKAALVAEIKSIIDGLRKSCDPNPLGNMQECMISAEIEALEVVLSSINEIEVKEVDLEKELLIGGITIFMEEGIKKQVANISKEQVKLNLPSISLSLV